MTRVGGVVYSARSSHRGLAVGLSGFLARELEEEGVATFASNFDILRAERATDALLGERRGIHRVVQEPRSVIVPEVVVDVVRVNPEGGEGDDVGHDA